MPSKSPSAIYLGTPITSGHQPDPVDIVQWCTEIEAALATAGTTGAQFTAGGPVAVATTANITLSGEQTIDGVTTSTDRVLVKDQTAPAENGIYVTGSGAWTRATDMDAAAEVSGTAVFVSGGTAGALTSWVTYSDVTTLGADAITFSQASDASGLSSALALKADASDVAALEAAVALKADASDVAALEAAVALKADASDVAALEAAVADGGTLSPTEVNWLNASDVEQFRIRIAGTNEPVSETWIDSAWWELFRVRINPASDQAGRMAFPLAPLIGDSAATMVEVYYPGNTQKLIPEGVHAINIPAAAGASVAPRMAEDVAPLDLDGTGWYVSLGDYGRPIVSSGADSYLLLEYMAVGQVQPVGALPSGGATLDLHIPSNAFFWGETTTHKVMQLPQGARGTVTRWSETLFAVHLEAGTGTTATGGYPVMSRSLLLVGQSNMAKPLGGAGLRGLQEAGLTDCCIINGALGSAAMLKATADARGGSASLQDNYFVDLAAEEPGPRLLDAIAAVNAAVAAGQPAPTAAALAQGEAEYLYMADTGDITAATYQAGIEYLIDYIRANTSVPSMKWYISPLGASDNYSAPGGYGAVRRAQLQVIANGTDIYQGPEYYDLSRPMYDVHIDLLAQREFFRRLAGHVLGGVDLGPAFKAITKSTDSVTISFTSTAILARPGASPGMSTPPELFGFAADHNVATWASWGGTTYDWSSAVWSVDGDGDHQITFTFDNVDVSACVVQYPAASAIDVRTRSIIRQLSGDRLPLRAFNA